MLAGLPRARLEGQLIGRNPLVLGNAAIQSDRSQGQSIRHTRFRHPLSTPLTDALMQAASADTARFVRSNAIAVLRQNPTASPQIPETLKRISQLDADAAIRRQAGEALEALSAVTTIHP